MKFIPRALSVRLALMFALVSMLLMGAIGLYLYQSLQKEIAWRDDQALLGRLQRMQALINESDSIETLRGRPKLYENMLGNRDNLLWIVDDTGTVLIEINPAHMAVPALPAAPVARLGDGHYADPVRLAWLDVVSGGRHLTLIAARLLVEREQMLGAYRLTLWLALSVGALFAFDLGSLMFWIETALFAYPLVVLASPRARENGKQLLYAAVSMILAGSLYRFDAFLVTFNPGTGYSYFPACPR